MPRHHASRGASISSALLEFAKQHRHALVLSVYIAGGMADPADRRHWAIVLRRGIAQRRRAISRRSRDERGKFDACVSTLLDRLPGEDAVHATAGWACFVGEPGAAIVEPLAYPTEPCVTWQTGVHIAPYVGAVAHPRAIVVVADRDHATLYRLADGALAELERLVVEPDIEAGPHMGTAPRQGFHPGTRGEPRREAAERRLREARARHSAVAASRAAAFAGADADVVIGGVAEAAAMVAEHLPASFAARTVRADAVRAATPGSETARLALAGLRALDAGRQQRLAAALVDDIGRHGHAAAGVLDVIHALEQRAVDHLIVSPTLIERHPDAIDHIVQEALFERAEIETAVGPAVAVLDAAGGIIARLRFPVPPAQLKPARGGPRRRVAAA